MLQVTAVGFHKRESAQMKTRPPRCTHGCSAPQTAECESALLVLGAAQVLLTSGGSQSHARRPRARPGALNRDLQDSRDSLHHESSARAQLVPYLTPYTLSYTEPLSRDGNDGASRESSPCLLQGRRMEPVPSRGPRVQAVSLEGHEVRPLRTAGDVEVDGVDEGPVRTRFESRATLCQPS